MKTLLEGKPWVPSSETDVSGTMRKYSPEYDAWLNEQYQSAAEAETFDEDVQALVSLVNTLTKAMSPASLPAGLHGKLLNAADRVETWMEQTEMLCIAG